MQPDNDITYSDGIGFLKYEIPAFGRAVGGGGDGFYRTSAAKILEELEKQNMAANTTKTLPKAPAKRHLNRDERHAKHRPAPNNGKDTDSLDLSDLGDI